MSKFNFKFIKVILAAALLTACLSPVFGFAARGAPDLDPQNVGYYITAFDISVVVTEKNVYQVTEKIDVMFTERSRGIFVNIPQIVEMKSPGARHDMYYIPVKNVKASDEIYTYTENNNFYIRMGNEYQYFTGAKSYTVSYDYHVGPDYSPELDFLYFDLIGGQWGTTISNVTFSLKMPKEFDSKGMSFIYSVNKMEKYAEFTSVGTTFSGSLSETLRPGDALTAYCELPQGYFTGFRNYSVYFVFAAVLLGFASLGLVFMMFRKYGRDPKFPQTVEFNAPDGLDSAYIGYAYDNTADNKDIISLIFYWADRGHLSITEEAKNKIVLGKLRSLPDDAPPYQQSVFDRLFSKGGSVSLKELENTFFSTLASSKKQLEKNCGQVLNDKKSAAMKAVAFLPVFSPIVLSIFTAAVSNVGGYSQYSLALVGSIFLLIFAAVSAVLFAKNTGKGKKRLPSLIFFGLTFTVLSAAIAGISAYYTLDKLYLLTLNGLFSTAGLIFAGFMGRKTEYGAKLHARVLGFRNFIQKAEKDRLERLVADDPAYFYHVLPYAYALGVTDAWAKRFEGIATAPPSWYYSSTVRGPNFSTVFFTSMLMKTGSRINTALSSTPVNANVGSGGVKIGGGGGFSGGGGSAGGGFGGGGGGRW